MFRSIFSLLCVGIIVTSATVMAQGKKGKPPGKVEPYTMSLTALKGPSLTDIQATFLTTDAANYPVPEILKKLQVKVLNDDGDAVYVKNFFDLPIDQDKVTVSVEELEAGMPVLVQAHIQTSGTVDEEVMKVKTNVLLRPDLVIDTVKALESVHVNTLFSAEVVLSEINGQTSTTAKVSLWNGEELIGTADNIKVLAGNMVSVVFDELVLTSVGPHHFTVRIHDADPAEYNTDNNEAEFTVEAVSPMVSVWYNLSYQSRKNHSYFYSSYSWCGGTTTVYTNEDYDDFSYYTSFYPPAGLNAPIDSLALEIRSANGTALHITLHSLTPGVSTADYDEYTFPVQTGSVSFNVRLRAYHTGYAYLEVRKYARNYYYRYTSSSGTIEVQQHDAMLGFQDYVEVRMALWDDGYAGGGAASMPMQPYYSYGSSYSYSSGWICRYYVNSYQSYQLSSSYASGYTDPEILPGMSQRAHNVDVAAIHLPATSDLMQNYPNPFNPETAISYEVPAVRGQMSEVSRVKIIVHDMLGRVVTTLVDETLPPGSYRATWNASSVPSGTYFLRMETQGFVQTRKMLLVK